MTPWTLRFIPAVIVDQMLPFKFGGAQESVDLFTKLAENALGHPGLEGAIRIGTGVVELIAVILLLIPKQSLKAALLIVDDDAWSSRKSRSRHWISRPWATSSNRSDRLDL